MIRGYFNVFVIILKFLKLIKVIYRSIETELEDVLDKASSENFKFKHAIQDLKSNYVY